jgi:hypothetical protein
MKHETIQLSPITWTIFQMIDWCLMSTLAVFQLHRGVFSNSMKTNKLHTKTWTTVENV